MPERERFLRNTQPGVAEKQGMRVYIPIYNSLHSHSDSGQNRAIGGAAEKQVGPFQKTGSKKLLSGFGISILHTHPFSLLMAGQEKQTAKIKNIKNRLRRYR